MSGNPKGFPLLFYPLFSCNHTICQQVMHIVHDNMKTLHYLTKKTCILLTFFLYLQCSNERTGHVRGV